MSGMPFLRANTRSNTSTTTLTHVKMEWIWAREAFQVSNVLQPILSCGISVVTELLVYYDEHVVNCQFPRYRMYMRQSTVVFNQQLLSYFNDLFIPHSAIHNYNTIDRLLIFIYLSLVLSVDS